MSKTSAIMRLGYEVNFILTESEVRALDALAGYGHKEFLSVFYEKMGRHYLEPHEKALLSLFEKCKELRPAIAAMDELNKEAIKVKSKFNT